MRKSAVRNIGIQFEKDLAAVLSADGRKTMDYRKNIRYFKSSDVHFYVGIPSVLLDLFYPVSKHDGAAGDFGRRRDRMDSALDALG